MSVSAISIDNSAIDLLELVLFAIKILENTFRMDYEYVGLIKENG